MTKRRLMTRRRRERKQVRLLSWVIGTAVWLWMIKATVVHGLRPTSIILTAPSTSHELNILFFLAEATAIAAFVMITIRLIAWYWFK